MDPNMKPRDIHRAVRPQRFDRAAGDAPSMGRVARVPGTGLPKGVRKRKRRHENSRGNRTRNHRKKVLMVWSWVLGLAATGAMGVIIWFWLWPQIQNRLAAPQDVAASQPSERVVSRFPSPSEEAALALVKKAISIRDATQVAEYFRLGESTPEEVVAFLQGMEERDGAITGFNWLSSIDANGLLIDGVLVETKLEDKPRNRVALLTPDEQGKWKIDFDALARKSKTAWSDLVANKVEMGQMRVVLVEDSYYNGLYKEEALWTCYGMASPDAQEILLGYCRKDSPQAAAMKRIILNGMARSEKRSPVRAMLEIKHAEGSEPRQFEITRVLAEDWVMADKDFDTNFK
jgi:hypothetical protein